MRGLSNNRPLYLTGNRLISLYAAHKLAPPVPKALIVFYLFNMMEYGNQAAAAEIKLALGR